MLIDWITFKLPFLSAPDLDWRSLMGATDRIQRFNPSTGVVTWEKTAWESIRSDSHGVTFRVSSDALFIQGSPARAEADGCNVFGGPAAQSLDLSTCMIPMISMVSHVLGVDLPPPSVWSVSRLDVTGNLCLPTLSDVRSSLAVLRGVEGGRYRVSQQAGDTVYWSHASKLRSGKAYAKGPHLRYQNKLADSGSEPYSQSKIDLADRLLRLELKLGSQFFRELSDRSGLASWHLITPDFLVSQWSSYFSRMLGSEVIDMRSDILDSLLSAVAAGSIPSEGQAKSAYSLWLLICSVGWQAAHDCTTKTTWYRGLKHLRAVGLGDADISSGQVVSLRRSALVLQPVTSWEQLRAA